MKLYRLIFAFNSILLTEVGIVAGQMEMTLNDHLTCFKIKDEHKITNVIVNMEANEAQKEFSVENCVMAKKALRMCIPSTKKVLTEGVADPTLGGLVEAYDPRRCVQNDLLCYKVTKCTTENTLKPRLVIDQFNEKGKKRKVRFKKVGMEICTPAWKLTPTGEIIVVDCGPPVAKSAAPSAAQSQTSASPSLASSASPTECVDDPTFMFNIPGMIEIYKCEDLIFPGIKEMACAIAYIALACCESCNASEAPTVSPTVSPTVCADDPAYRFYVKCLDGSPFCQEFGCADILTFPGLRERACASANVALACCISCNASEAPTASPVRQIDQCRYKKCLSLLGQSYAPFVPTQGNTLTWVNQPPIDHRLYFGLTPHTFQNGWHSVMNFSTGANAGYGSQVPGVWLDWNILRVRWGGISFAPIGGTSPYLSSPPLNLGQTYCFMVTAQGTHYELYMDGAKVAEGDAEFLRTQLSSVKVYAGTPGSPAADATISDLCYAAM